MYSLESSNKKIISQIETSLNTLHNGAVKVLQPINGYRAGLDPVLLSAFALCDKGDLVLDVGCGVGTASLCLADRQKEAIIEGIELQSDLVTIGNENIILNKYHDRMMFVTGEIMNCPRVIKDKNYDAIITNPPYQKKNASTTAEHPIKYTANAETTAVLMDWINFCAKRLRPRGKFTMIHRADRIHEIIQHMSRKFGDIQIIPIWPHANQTANRVIIKAIKGAQGKAILHPGLIVHQANEDYTKEALKIISGK